MQVLALFSKSDNSDASTELIDTDDLQEGTIFTMFILHGRVTMI